MITFFAGLTILAIIGIFVAGLTVPVVHWLLKLIIKH